MQAPTTTNNSMGTSTDISVTPSTPIWVPELEYYVMLVKRITDSILNITNAVFIELIKY